MADKKSSEKLELPLLDEKKPYDEWLRRINWWRLQTTVPADKQGLAIASSLSGKALSSGKGQRRPNTNNGSYRLYFVG